MQQANEVEDVAFGAAREALEQALGLLKDTRNAEVVRVLVDLSTLLTLYLGRQTEGAAYAQQALEMARLESVRVPLGACLPSSASSVPVTTVTAFYRSR